MCIFKRKKKILIRGIRTLGWIWISDFWAVVKLCDRDFRPLKICHVGARGRAPRKAFPLGSDGRAAVGVSPLSCWACCLGTHAPCGPEGTRPTTGSLDERKAPGSLAGVETFLPLSPALPDIAHNMTPSSGGHPGCSTAGHVLEAPSQLA